MTDDNQPRRWTRPAPAEPYCSISAVADGSYHTMCRGRYSVAEPDVHVVYGDPELDECCRGCIAAVLGARTLTPIERPLPVFDISDQVFGPETVVVDVDDIEGEWGVE